MNLLVLKFWHEVRFAISLIFVLLAFISNAQEQKKAPGLLLIEHILAVDTTINYYTKERIKIAMKRRPRSKLDSLALVEKIKNRGRNVFEFARNNGVKKKLEKRILKKDATLLKYFNKEELLFIIENIPPNQNHNLVFLAKGFHIIREQQPQLNPIPTHYFSSSFKSNTNDRYIVFHKKVNGFQNGYSEFVIYDYLDGKIIIKASIPLGIY